MPRISITVSYDTCEPILMSNLQSSNWLSAIVSVSLLRRRCFTLSNLPTERGELRVSPRDLQTPTHSIWSFTFSTLDSRRLSCEPRSVESTPACVCIQLLRYVKQSASSESTTYSTLRLSPTRYLHASAAMRTSRPPSLQYLCD